MTLQPRYSIKQFAGQADISLKHSLTGQPHIKTGKALSEGNEVLQQLQYANILEAYERRARI